MADFRYYEQATAELKRGIIEAYDDIMSGSNSTEAIARRLDFALREAYRLLDKYTNDAPWEGTDEPVQS